jgi:hypothetical protein
MTLSIKGKCVTLSITTLSLTTLSKKDLYLTLNINNTQHYNIVIMLSVIMLNDVMITVWRPLNSAKDCLS